jgi:hypothetical protein
MLRTIKTLLIRLWVWLTPRAAKYQIQSDFMRAMTDPNRPKIATNLTQPLRRRPDYGGIGRSMIQVEPLPPGALPIYDKEPTDGNAP